MISRVHSLLLFTVVCFNRSCFSMLDFLGWMMFWCVIIHVMLVGCSADGIWVYVSKWWVSSDGYFHPPGGRHNQQSMLEDVARHSHNSFFRSFHKVLFMTFICLSLLELFFWYLSQVSFQEFLTPSIWQTIPLVTSFSFMECMLHFHQTHRNMRGLVTSMKHIVMTILNFRGNHWVYSLSTVSSVFLESDNRFIIDRWQFFENEVWFCLC